MSEPIKSYEPATGQLLWEAPPSAVDEQIKLVERCWPAWAAMPSSYRIETMRRFANGVRAAEDAFSDLIARETGRPLWHARAEIAELVERVDKAIGAFS